MANEKRILKDANAVIEEIEKAQISLQSNNDAVWNMNQKYFKGLAWAHRIVLDAPTVDAVEVVHGEWLDGYAVDSNGKKVYDSIDCSVCEEVFKIESHDREYWKGRFKRCFCCGADMRERSDGE